MGFPPGPLSDAPPSLDGGGVTRLTSAANPGTGLSGGDSFYVVTVGAAPDNEVQLPSLGSTPGGTRIIVKNNDVANDLVVNAATGELIDGAVPLFTVSAGASVTFTSDVGSPPPLLFTPSWWTQNA